jgi:hypothetical protein
MFAIEDEAHAELIAEFETREEAIHELRRRSEIAWDQPPNVAPCTSWRTCGRRYELAQYDTSTSPWREMQRSLVLQISANGVGWTPEAETPSQG